MPQVFFIGRHITDVWMDRGINLCCFRQNRGAVLPGNLIVHIYFFYGMGFCLFIGKCIVPGCRYAVGSDIDCDGFRVIRITGVVDSGNTKCLIG